MPPSIPRSPDLAWYFSSAEAAAGAMKSQHGSFVAMASIGPRSMPPPIDAERALGRRFDQIDGQASDAERARCVYLALQKLTREQVTTLARAYGPDDLSALVGAAYPGDFGARDRFMAAFGEYAGIVAALPRARHFARPSGAKDAPLADAQQLLDTAIVWLGDALMDYQAARARVREELQAYTPAGWRAARAATVTALAASW